QKEYDIIDAYCKEKEIIWFASAWDEGSQKFFSQYNFKHNKVASAMLTHDKILHMIAEEKKHTFISTGMSDYKMIDNAVEIFKKHNCPFSLMHCVSTYPSDDEECNIAAMKELRNRYKCDVGYSGHEKGILPSILAIADGATCLERHITVDRTMYGSDQAASLEKRGLELMVRDARRVARILGSGHKTITDKEKSIAKKLRYHEEVCVD
ncbi:MAG: N-acetylneuraminate synthase family protein, partial [Elusimicrobiales bacterium]|nr:N-acetylneuraminate synthase family protein [Elusimicrobiales bacterium]